MRHKNYFISLLLVLAALTASAQTCPGPANRTALINLQKSQIVNGTRWGQTVLTDTCGNQRYVTLDSIIVIIVDSIAADTTLQRNWYTHNGVTTDLGRFAYIKRTAWWLGLDSVGFIRFTMRPDLFNGPQLTLFQDSFVVEYANNVAVRNYISLADTGVVIATTGDEARSVNVRTDTVNWSSSFDPALQIHNLRADGTYFYADSLKVVGIGQFSDLQNIVFDGTYKGFYYYPDGDGVMIINGDGVNGYTSQIVARQNDAYMQLNDVPGDRGARFQLDLGASFWSTHNSVNPTYSEIITNLTNIEDVVIYTTRLVGLDTNRNIITYFGLSDSPSAGYTGRRAWGVRSYISEGEVPTEEFDWLQAYLPNDTTENAVSLYNRAYYWKNEHPIGAAGDTLFHFWAATGPGGEAGKDPGFMTLDAICAHCSESAVNWYNSNGTTTENTRIATVTETATWLSDDVTVDGVFPFRFELAGGVPNEPEMMVWKFPTDSATLYQSDQELVLHSTNQWVFRSDEQTRIWADSFSYSNGSSGGFAVTQYNRITQSSVSNGDKQDLLENRTITGTAQTELFLDGSSAVLTLPANRNNNFEIHVSAICSDAGNGVGITTGDAYASWHVGGIKRVVNTTSLVGTVQTTATAQSDASMSTSVVTIDADDTDDSLRIRFTPPSTAGSTTVLRVLATIQLSQIGY